MYKIKIVFTDGGDLTHESEYPTMTKAVVGAKSLMGKMSPVSHIDVLQKFDNPTRFRTAVRLFNLDK